jgi:hypothetical protein
MIVTVSKNILVQLERRFINHSPVLYRYLYFERFMVSTHYCVRSQIPVITLTGTQKIKVPLYIYSSWGTSDSIVSEYGLDDQTTGVRSPAEVKYFSSSLCVQTRSGTHPASYPRGTGDKARQARDADHTTHLEPRSIMSRSYIYFNLSLYSFLAYFPS